MKSTQKAEEIGKTNQKHEKIIEIYPKKRVNMNGTGKKIKQQQKRRRQRGNDNAV